MKKLLIAMAAVAMVGAANAAASYSYCADVMVSNYAAKDSYPSNEHATWYSCYCLTQASAKEAMGTSDAVTYSTYAAWLGKNFAANKQETIDNAQSVSFYTAFGQYEFYKTQGSGDMLSGALGVVFFDNGNGDLAYHVLASYDGANGFYCDSDPSWGTGSSGWIPVEEEGDVPEPTSGMLMLLGMAGLALKRKRA